MNALTQDQVEEAVLMFLHDRANEGFGKGKAEEFSGKLGIPEPRVAMALRSLDKRGLARAAHNYLYGSSYEISEEGYRHVEAAHSHAANGAEAAPDHEKLLHQLIPASDRIVSPSHNAPGYVPAVEQVEEAQRLIASSNQIPEEEKQDALLHLEAGLSLLKKAKNFAVGAIRYLILDRLKAAFEGAIEDAFKITIIGAFLTLAAFLIAML